MITIIIIIYITIIIIIILFRLGQIKYSPRTSDQTTWARLIQKSSTIALKNGES